MLMTKQQNTRRTLGYGRRQQKEKQVEDGESNFVAAEEIVGKGLMQIEDMVE